MIRIDDHFYFDQPHLEDQDALVEYLNDPAILQNTLTIPAPYEAENARSFIEMAATFFQKHGFFKDLFIRDESGKCIGGIGLLYQHGVDSHKSEIGYWLGRPYWSKGIMTKAVRRFSQWAFEEKGLVRLEAGVFLHNPASARVLEKAGYEFEGLLKKYEKKDDSYLDVRLYAKIALD